MGKTSAFILLADDDIEDQIMLKEAIVRLNPLTEVKAVSNGLEMLAFLNERPAADFPSLILLDYKMPILNAEEVLQRMLADGRYEAIAKVVWSTSQQEEHMQRCKKVGAAHYFVKPDNVADLYTLARQLLELSNV